MSTFIPINIGQFANDGTGDSLRTAFQKINANFSQIVGNVVLNTSNISTANSTPVIDLSTGTKQIINLISNVSSSVAINGIDSQEYTFVIQQTTGSDSWIWPSNFSGGGNISASNFNTSPGSYCTQQFLFNKTANIYYTVSPLLYVGS